MDLQDLDPRLLVRAVDQDLAVEAAGPQQRRVEDLRAVRGGEQDDALTRIEAVELGEELVEGLLLLVVAAAHRPDAARAAQRIELVDEDDAGRTFARLLEEITDAGGPHPDEHLDELAPADGEEGHTGLPRHRAGQERLSRSRRTDEQDALGQPGAQAAVLIGRLQEPDDLLQLLLGFVHPRHVVEGDLDVVFRVDAGLALADREDPSTDPRALGEASQQEHPYEHQEAEGQDPREQTREPGVLVDPGEFDALLRKRVGDRGIDADRAESPELPLLGISQ